MLETLRDAILFPLYGRVNTSPYEDLPYILKKNHKPLYNLIFFHGNGCTIVGGSEFCEVMYTFGCNILTIEYPGYYTSTDGYEKNYFDYDLFMNKLEKRYRELILTLPDLPIILVGQSIGSVVAGMIARTNPISKLILITPIAKIGYGFFNDIRNVAFLIVNQAPFDNIKMLQNTVFPVMLITATLDNVVDNINTKALKNVRGLVNLIIDRGHNDINFYSRSLIEKTNCFIKGELPNGDYIIDDYRNIMTIEVTGLPYYLWGWIGTYTKKNILVNNERISAYYLKPKVYYCINIIGVYILFYNGKWVFYREIDTFGTFIDQRLHTLSCKNDKQYYLPNGRVP